MFSDIMADSSRHSDFPIRALSELDKRIVTNAIEYRSGKQEREIEDTANVMFPIHKELHRIYWDDGKEFPSTTGGPFYVGTREIICQGQIIVFREYQRLLRVIKAQVGVKPGVIICGSPGIGIYPSPC
jgi:hypothetical protein